MPGVGIGALYKYEITTRGGEVTLKADPYAFQAEHPPRTASIVRGLPRRPTLEFHLLVELFFVRDLEAGFCQRRVPFLHSPSAQVARIAEALVGIDVIADAAFRHHIVHHREDAARLEHAVDFTEHSDERLNVFLRRSLKADAVNTVVPLAPVRRRSHAKIDGVTGQSPEHF